MYDFWPIPFFSAGRQGQGVKQEGKYEQVQLSKVELEIEKIIFLRVSQLFTIHAFHFIYGSKESTKGRFIF